MNSRELVEFSFEENKSSIIKEEYEEIESQKLKSYTKIFILIFSIIILFVGSYIIRQRKNPYFLINKLKKKVSMNKIEKRPNNNSYCDNLDPIYMFNLRLQNDPYKICETETSHHICYMNNKGYHNDIFYYPNGVICKMKNFVLDPSKSKQSDIIYKGPVDKKTFGCPILSKGFFNMKCKNKNKIEGYSSLYDNYFNSWNYDYESDEELEELAPGKTIFFLSRNQDSPNIFHGGSELMNAISMMHLFNLEPENIQIIFLESMTINNDPFYDLYKNIVSRGGEPIYIKNLKKKYHISSAIHVPINWDSPCMITNSYQNCKYSTKAYKLFSELVNKYMNIPEFKDSFKSDNEIYYYPKSVIDNHNSNTIFNKSITIQWRKVWPKGRTGQFRILGNGPQLADKLASVLPKNFLIRLVDNAGLSMSEQISLMKKTDYLVGIHGAGLCLSVFMPNESILHEVLPSKNMRVLVVMSSLSGHMTYSDIIRYKINNDDGNQNIHFQPNIFAKKVLTHMIENDYL